MPPRIAWAAWSKRVVIARAKSIATSTASHYSPALSWTEKPASSARSASRVSAGPKPGPTCVVWATASVTRLRRSGRSVRSVAYRPAKQVLAARPACALRSEGESCTYDDAGECAYGLACSQLRICEPLAGSGERCSTSEDCRMIGETCGFNATCEPVRQVGDTCLQDSQCSLHYQCGVSGLCEAGPRIGERCFGYHDCYDAGAFCDAGDSQVCARPKPDGASCGIFTECASAICVDRTCVATCESN